MKSDSEASKAEDDDKPERAKKTENETKNTGKKEKTDSEMKRGKESARTWEKITQAIKERGKGKQEECKKERDDTGKTDRKGKTKTAAGTKRTTGENASNKQATETVDKTTISLDDMTRQADEGIATYFGSNVTYASEKAVDYVYNLQDDVIAISETHLDRDKTLDFLKRMRKREQVECSGSVRSQESRKKRAICRGSDGGAQGPQGNANRNRPRMCDR